MLTRVNVPLVGKDLILILSKVSLSSISEKLNSEPFDEKVYFEFDVALEPYVPSIFFSFI